MKVRASVKKICNKCKVIKRKGVVRVICKDPSTSKDKDKEATWLESPESKSPITSGWKSV